MNETIIIKEKDETDVAIDYIFCPHCGAEMVRDKMQNPYTIYGVSYTCQCCGATELRSPNLPEEY